MCCFPVSPFNVFYQQPSDGPDTAAPVHTPALWECGINNTLPCIMPFLSMIVMIKGIYLITGLLNYSSVEARLFRRVLIALLSLWHTLLSSAALLCSFELREGWSAQGPKDGWRQSGGGCRGNMHAHRSLFFKLLYRSRRVTDQSRFLSG